MRVCARICTYMCVCVYIYLMRNPETVHRNTSISKYSIPAINLE